MSKRVDKIKVILKIKITYQSIKLININHPSSINQFCKRAPEHYFYLKNMGSAYYF